jgi:hypothetical protein
MEGRAMNSKVQAQTLTVAELSARSTARILGMAIMAFFVATALLSALSY